MGIPAIARAIALVAIALGSTVACREASVDDRPRLVVRDVSPAAFDGVLALPSDPDSIKFAIIGDSGRGNRPQHEVADRMSSLRERFPFEFVLMLGDNIYEGPATADDYRKKFEEPYAALLEDDVRFFAVLGNHDDPRQVSFPPFNMKGERYYSFAPPVNLRARLSERAEFFAIDSTRLDSTQLKWLDARLDASHADWKIVFLHHPLYTSGRYRRTARLHRGTLEPIFVRHGVSVVFSGHEHIYQRTTLRNGIQYFISGGAGSLRVGDGVQAPYIAKTFADDYHFMLVEIEGDTLHFQTVSRGGETIDAGAITRTPAPRETAAATPAGTAGRR